MLVQRMCRVLLAVVVVSTAVIPVRSEAFQPAARFLQACTSKVRRLRHMRFHRLLNRRPVEGARIMDYLARHFLEVRDNIDQSAHVKERCSIREHHLTVFDEARVQAPALDFRGLRAPAGVDLEPLFYAMLGLHDIGKHLAQTHKGTRHAQHEFTVPILTGVLTKLGFRPPAVEVAAALVDNKIFELLDRQYKDGETPDVPEAVRLTQELSERCGMGRRDMFRLLRFFHTIDAGSYPGMQKRAFIRDPDGRHTYVAPCFADFARQIGVLD